MALQAACTNTGAAGQSNLSYGLASERDLDEAARIFVEQFPERADRWFAKRSHALCFYRDLMELLWRMHGSTFYVARQAGALRGYLVLTVPGRSLVRGMTSGTFFVRAAAHGISGRYGFRALPKVVKELAGLGKSSQAEEVLAAPCVYVVAVASHSTGKGIGSRLLEDALRFCRGRFSAVWLNVEKENCGAIRIYERLGFRSIASDDTQFTMLCQLPAAAHQASQPTTGASEGSRA
ncbi:MAG: GNAT family N-acetyltransferase [Candidatus Acidiferrales bacterium]